MKKLMVLLTLLLMSTAAFAQTYYLMSQSYNRSNGIRTCNYTGGHVLTVGGGRTCPYRIER